MANQMEYEEIDSRWVDDRMKALDPAADWRPDASRGLARMRAKDVASRGETGGKRRWLWTTATAAGTLFLLLALGASQSCAWGACLLPGNVGFLPAAAVSADAAFKTTGAASATITLEIYSDYECPYCAKFFEETVPLLEDQYVRTGKVRLVHRDFPLPQHPWAKLAARYANAAGELGQYSVAVNHIFRTQGSWNKDGNIDAQLAAVLPPDVMQKVREKVKSDPRLDDSVAADLGMVASDHVNQTPTLVIVTKEGRRTFAPIPPFVVLKSYLDQLLSR
jgi:protein-disulfide isomerase